MLKQKKKSLVLMRWKPFKDTWRKRFCFLAFGSLTILSAFMRPVFWEYSLSLFFAEFPLKVPRQIMAQRRILKTLTLRK